MLSWFTYIRIVLFFGGGGHVFPSGDLFRRHHKYLGRHCARTLSPYTVTINAARTFIIIIIIILYFFFIDFFFCLFLLLWLPLNYGQKIDCHRRLFVCVCIILFILGHARNCSIAWARFDQTLVQYSCCWNKRRGALPSFKMGDQSIPGQDEDIFLGTNQITCFFFFY